LRDILMKDITIITWVKYGKIAANFNYWMTSKFLWQ